VEKIMSANYDRYKAMNPAQLQQAIDDRRVTEEYLGWLGIAGPGAQLRKLLSAFEAMAENVTNGKKGQSNGS
jgi:hypothetical protein